MLCERCKSLIHPGQNCSHYFIIFIIIVFFLALGRSVFNLHLHPSSFILRSKPGPKHLRSPKISKHEQFLLYPPKARAENRLRHLSPGGLNPLMWLLASAVHRPPARLTSPNLPVQFYDRPPWAGPSAFGFCSGSFSFGPLGHLLIVSNWPRL